MKPDANKLKAIAGECERAGCILGAAIARGDGLIRALAELDPSGTAGDEREIMRALSDAFFAGLGRTGRLRMSQSFGKP